VASHDPHIKALPGTQRPQGVPWAWSPKWEQLRLPPAHQPYPWLPWAHCRIRSHPRSKRRCTSCAHSGHCSCGDIPHTDSSNYTCPPRWSQAIGPQPRAWRCGHSSFSGVRDSTEREPRGHQHAASTKQPCSPSLTPDPNPEQHQTPPQHPQGRGLLSWGGEPIPHPTQPPVLA
jgi:hypothetical protein